MASAKSKMSRDVPPLLDAEALLDGAPSLPSAAVGYVVSVVMTAVATVVAIGVDSGVAIPNLSLVFVVPVVVAGVCFGLGPSLCSAILGSLAYNFFLTEPRYTLMVDDPANIWAIALLFVIGIIVSGVAHTSRHRGTDAAHLRRQALLLKDYSREIAGAGNAKVISTITSKALAALFDVPAIVVLVSGDKVSFFESVGDIAPQAAELDAALSSAATGTVQLAEVYPESRFDFWPVSTASDQRAVLGLAFDAAGRPDAPETLIDVVRSILTLALDRRPTI
ncbi:DUF4118 domain-containing protein [Ensifer adhaerens]|uniref:DUF4118 domain-containing protein n=1 Tax=Ensifer adhaerens TaxID=106592 RepID=UPI00098F9653|nr:DUF4118 domain-containing protein [Ensifer adhaerens]